MPCKLCEGTTVYSTGKMEQEQRTREGAERKCLESKSCEELKPYRRGLRNVGEVASILLEGNGEAYLTVPDEKFERQLIQSLKNKGVEVTERRWVPCG